MICMGAYALLAQILLLREFLVVFFGNELTIGAMFCTWLVLIGAGSLLATFIIARWSAEHLRVLLVILLVLAAVLLPLQVGAIRIVWTALHVAYGEYAAFFSMLASLAVILAPGCLIIGIAFPCACRLAARQLPYAVGRVYAAESLGSMVAGAAFSFWLVWIMSPLAVAMLAGAIALLGAAGLTVVRTLHWALGLAALAFMGLACCPACLAPLERASVEGRWRSFGVLPSSGSAHPSAARLLASCDSRYQNLALIETEGQITLYANGQVMAVFPDAITGEHKIHFVMAQKPEARRVLLIGGNPVNDIPELLKYPLQKLVHIELDDKINGLLESVASADFRQALRDPRLEQIHMDALRYVKQYGRRDAMHQLRGGKCFLSFPTRSGIQENLMLDSRFRGNDSMEVRYPTPITEVASGATAPWGTTAPLFDAILVDAAEPATIALNRFYTQDFYRDIRSILSPDGFLYTAVSASEDLQGEAAFLSASICAALQAVFGRVLVTSGTKNQFFAGATNSPVTLARATLFRRSAGADIKTHYFRPEYFLNADEISPEKLDFVERQLAAIPVTANAVLKPVSTFYQIALWSRFSGSGLESLLVWLARLRQGWVTGALLGFGLVCLGIGVVLGRRPACAKQGCVILPHERHVKARGLHRITEIVGPVPSPGAGGPASFFSRSMLVVVMAATGLCGMALELILIFVFQSLLGYVYSKVGLIVAMFMLGLTLGATGCVPTLKRSGQWRAMAVMEILLIAEAACIPWLMTGLSSSLMPWIPWGWVEALIYGLIAVSGALVGAQFVLVNELLKNVAPAMPSRDTADAGQGVTAAITNTADLVGAALGGLVVGVLLLPLFGITATCFLLAALKVASLLCLLAASFSYQPGSVTERAACV